MREDRQHLGMGEHDGDALRALGANEVAYLVELAAEDLAVEEEQRGKGLVLRGCTDLVFGS